MLAYACDGSWSLVIVYITKTHPCSTTENFLVVKKESFHWKKIDEGVLTSTHNLCFGAKIRKIGIALHTPVFVYKNGVQGCKHYTDMLS